MKRILAVSVAVAGLIAPAARANYASCETTALGPPRVNSGQSWPPLVCETSLAPGSYQAHASWSGTGDLAPDAVGVVQIAVASDDRSVLGVVHCELRPPTRFTLYPDCSAEGNGFSTWATSQSSGLLNGYSIRFTTTQPVTVYFAVGEVTLARQGDTTVGDLRGRFTFRIPEVFHAES